MYATTSWWRELRNALCTVKRELNILKLFIWTSWFKELITTSAVHFRVSTVLPYISCSYNGLSVSFFICLSTGLLVRPSTLLPVHLLCLVFVSYLISVWYCHIDFRFVASSMTQCPFEQVVEVCFPIFLLYVLAASFVYLVNTLHKHYHLCSTINADHSGHLLSDMKSSLAQKLWSWVRILLKAGISMCSFCLCVVLCVGICLAKGLIARLKSLPTVYKI
jgi:hypothetical protein